MDKLPFEQDGPQDEFFSIQLTEIWNAIRMRPWLIVLAIVVCTAGFYVKAAREAKVYVAVAELIINPVLPKVLGDVTDVEDLSRSNAEAAFYNTQYDIMQSRAVFRETIVRLKLNTDEKFAKDYGLTSTGEVRLKQVESILRGRLVVAPTRTSRVVRVVVEDYDPDRAARIANTHAQVYMDQSLEARLATTRNASKWLDERVEEFSADLERSEKALADFKRQNSLVSVSLEDRKNMIAAGLTKFNEQLISVRNQLIELESERKVVQSVIDAGDVATRNLESVPRVGKSKSVAGLKDTLVELEQKRADLKSRYGPRHPNMVAVLNQIGRVRGLLDDEIKLIIGALDNEIATLTNRQERLRLEMDSEVQRAMNLNNLGLEYTKLSRKLGTNEKTYESLLKRRTETDLSGLLESNFVRWLQTAEPIPSPIRPSIPLQAALGALLGLFIGLSIITIGVLLDNTIHTQAEVEERLGLAFLGLLPKIGELKKTTPDKYSRDRDLFIVKNPKSAVAECARSVRTNLMFMGAEKEIKRLLLTSAGPSEGKSTTVIALGSTMAQAGSRVLIIDTDLRRPRLHKVFEVSGESGLTSVLLGENDLDAATKSTDVRGLDILPCGPLPPNPSELLHTEKFLELLDEIDERYDRILFDSPPINAVTDGLILSQNVDGTVLVVKASKTTKEAARRAARQLKDVKANMLGVVLNDVDLKHGAYYRDHYYQYYRTGYAYGSEGDKAEV